MVSSRNMYNVFFNDTATTEIYTLSLHDALPICVAALHLVPVACHHGLQHLAPAICGVHVPGPQRTAFRDRKSTRLNSSHANISYAVFCLKKKITPHDLYCNPLHTASPPLSISNV